MALGWDTIYVIVDLIICGLLIHRAARRVQWRMYRSAGVIFFMWFFYAQITVLRVGIVFGDSYADHLNTPGFVLGRTIPLIVLLWASKDGQEHILPRLDDEISESIPTSRNRPNG